MATYSTVWAWIIPTTPRAKKAFTENAAKKIAIQAGVPWDRVKKQKSGVRAQVRRKGFPPQSETFPNKGKAETWATQMEASMVSGEFKDLAVARSLTVADLLDRYKEDQALGKQDCTRVNLLTQHLGDITLDILHSGHCLDFAKKRRGTPADKLAAYEKWVARQVAQGEVDAADAEELLRDARSGDMKLPPIVKDATIRRDLDLLGCAIAWAKDHLKLRLIENPLPATRRHLVINNERSRRPTDEELMKLYAETDSPQLKPAIELAIETAMRRTELCGVRIEDIDWQKRIIALPKEKADRFKTDRSSGRDVPLSGEAVRLLKDIIGERRSGRVFDFEPDSLTQAFSRACKRAKISDLVFHDLRHHSLSSWAERGMSIHDLQLIGGHRDLRSLTRYIHGRADTVAQKMRSMGESNSPVET